MTTELVGRWLVVGVADEVAGAAEEAGAVIKMVDAGGAGLASNRVTDQVDEAQADNKKMVGVAVEAGEVEGPVNS